MSKIYSKPAADHLPKISQVDMPVSYSTPKGLALLLSDTILSADKVVPQARVIPTEQFLSGQYSFPLPAGYTAAECQLPMLEPASLFVVGDTIVAYQPVKLYQIGNKAYVDDQGVGVAADLLKTSFPVKIPTTPYTVEGQKIKPLEANQSVVIRIFKEPGVGIDWARSTVVNNGLPDAAIAAATELTFVVTACLGTYQVTEWVTPDFVTTGIGALKTAAKSNFAAIINELFDKAAAPAGPAGGDLAGTYPAPTIGAGKVTGAKLNANVADGSTVGLLSSALKVLMAPKLGNTVAVTDFKNPPAAIANLASGEMVPISFRQAANGPAGVTPIGAGFAQRNLTGEYTTIIYYITDSKGGGDLAPLWMGKLVGNATAIQWYCLAQEGISPTVTVSDFRTAGTTHLLPKGEMRAFKTIDSDSVPGNPYSDKCCGYMVGIIDNNGIPGNFIFAVCNDVGFVSMDDNRRGAQFATGVSMQGDSDTPKWDYYPQKIEPAMVPIWKGKKNLISGVEYTVDCCYDPFGEFPMADVMIAISLEGPASTDDAILMGPSPGCLYATLEPSRWCEIQLPYVWMKGGTIYRLYTATLRILLDPGSRRLNFEIDGEFNLRKFYIHRIWAINGLTD